jgi:carbamate kinase
MRIVIALGGNALLRRDQPMTAENQRDNIKAAMARIAAIAPGNELIITHGNGPQVGLLALQAASYPEVTSYPLDVLGAETEGMIGYMIEQELGNALPAGRPLATLLTQVEIDSDDPAFRNPTKPIGPVYEAAEAKAIGQERGWAFAPDGDKLRRVVASPRPQRIVEIRPISWLLERGAVVVCAGGGGIPVTRGRDGRMQGVEAVIDKDHCSSLLARELHADMLVIATDVAGVFIGWGTPEQKAIAAAGAETLDKLAFPSGSMGPKVAAACAFAAASGKPAVIGALTEIDRMIEGAAGTRVVAGAAPLAFH